jgi:hypothetical protein
VDGWRGQNHCASRRKVLAQRTLYLGLLCCSSTGPAGASTGLSSLKSSKCQVLVHILNSLVLIGTSLAYLPAK